MNRRPLAAAVLTLCALCVPAARAADVPEAVTKRVNELTFAVVRIDVSANDPQRWTKWAVDLMNKTDLPADMKAEMNRNVAGPTDADRAFADLKKAGVTVAWVVVAMGSRNEPVDFAVILPGVTDLEALRATLAGMPLRHDVDGKAVIITRWPEFLDGFVAAARPELLKPITAAPAGQTVASVIVPDDLRNLLKTFLPVFPKELGGGPTTVISDGVREVLFTVDAPPTFGTKVSIKSKDAASATNLAAFVDKLSGLAKQAAPGGELNSAVDELHPTAAGDTLTLTIDSARAERLAKAAAPALVKARQAAQAQVSMSNLRQLAIATLMYGNDHRSDVPNAIDDLKPYLGQGVDAVMVNPRRANQAGYVYVKPFENKLSAIKDGANRVLFYEAGGFADGGVVVAFADGHVQMITDKAQFDALLAAAQKPAP